MSRLRSSSTARPRPTEQGVGHTEKPDLPVLTRIIAVASMPLFFLVVFTLSYLSATHAPVPRDLALTVAGPAQVTETIANAIDERADGRVVVSRTTDLDAARRAVAEREAVGALLLDGPDVTTVVASGEGGLPKGLVIDIGQQVAAETGGTATVDDVAPLSPDDPGGSSLFFFFIVTVVGAFLTVTMVSQVLGSPRTRTLVLTSVGAAVVAPIVSFAVLSLFVDFGVPFGSAVAVIGIGMMTALTSGLIASIFTRLLGGASIFGIIVVLVALNFPSAGSTVPASMLPEFWQVIHGVWFGSGAFESMRSILFFEGNGAGRWVLQLGIWLVASIVALALITALQKRRASGAARLGVPDADHSSDATPDTASDDRSEPTVHLTQTDESTGRHAELTR